MFLVSCFWRRGCQRCHDTVHLKVPYCGVNTK
uniref:Uncharacterized protein n=1 Tax=Anguilla anguilla TaxID=7936 RepID=A0A0E9R967_ANGAN